MSSDTALSSLRFLHAKAVYRVIRLMLSARFPADCWPVDADIPRHGLEAAVARDNTGRLRKEARKDYAHALKQMLDRRRQRQAGVAP